MAPLGNQHLYMPLRMVTQRLASTSTQRLPHVLPSLVAVLSESKQCFAAAQSTSGGHDASEGPVLIHKLKTQISALLQDRKAEAKYAAIVLIKATVEAGGWSVLQGASAWVKALIGLLGVSSLYMNERYHLMKSEIPVQ